jgi:Zn-dependent metalloprotease
MKKLTVLTAFAMLAFAQIGMAQRAEVRGYHNDGTPHFIQFDGQGARLGAVAPEQLLQQQLNPTGTPSAFAFRQANTDDLGMTHHQYLQSFKGLPVEYGQYTIHERNGNAVSMSGRYFSIAPDFVTKPTLNAQAAFQRAKAFVGARKYMWETPGNDYSMPAGELVIVPNYFPDSKTQDMAPTLAYKFDIYAEEPVSRAYIYVDAHSGEIIHFNPIIKHAVATGTAATRYSGSRSIKTDSYSGSYRLRDTSRGGGIQTYNMKRGTNYSTATDFTDADNNWTAAEWNNTNKDNAALDAHWGAQMTYDYFMQKHNRNSYNGSGAIIKSYVHYSSNYDNAFWDGQRMTYGDGSGTYFDALTSLDVAAHEIGHAVCENTANLVYQRESGALNEGFSDIWGACVEYFAAPEKSRWLIGEDIEKRSGHAALRSMSNPNSEGQPDTYGGTYWQNPNCGTPTQSNDYCGVHTNSGVLNYWFYLLTQGASGTNDIGSAFSVTGIGIDKAAAIAYRTEAVYLNSTSTFAAARQYSIQSAVELYGAGSAEEIATTNAWHAVGVGAAYSGGGTGGGGGSTCSDTEVVLTLTFDNYPAETAWTLKNSSGTTIASGNGYSAKNATINETFCLANGTYSFNITDSYGDGICCSYGNGGYTLKQGSTTLASGGSYGSGETKTFTIGTAPATCGTVTGLGSSAVTATSFTLSWAALTGASNYDVEVNGSVISTGITGTSINVTGATASTAYACRVRANCSNGATGSFSSALNVTTASGGGTAPTGYCASKGNNNTYEWIDLVAVGGINNTSSKTTGGYADYTSQTGTLTIGSSATINFSAGFSSSSYTEYWAVYIDLNRDGDFSDSGEKVVTGSSSSSGTLSGTINVPSTASAGLTRMRVSMKYNAAQTSPCETFSYGEVEDYTISLVPAGTVVASLSPLQTLDGASERLGNEPSTRDFVVFPNPASSQVSVRMARGNSGVTVTLFDMTGKALGEADMENGEASFDVSQLPRGMYLIQANDGRQVTMQKFMKQ